MGAWVETYLLNWSDSHALVAPYVGAWVETACLNRISAEQTVAPYVGAWVETQDYRSQIKKHFGRTLRGCVG